MGKDRERGGPIAADTPPRSAKAGFDDLIVVCAKCAKRQGLAKRAFGRTLKRAFKRETGGRRMRVVETGCLGPCPKRLVAVATSGSIDRSRVLLLDPLLSPATVRGLFPGASRAESDAGETPS